MPTHTCCDHTARLAVLEAHGEVTRDEAIGQFRAVCAELAEARARGADGRYGVLIDTRQAANVPTPADILAIRSEIDRHRAVLPPSRWAVLASEPAHFGMGRLFSVYAEGSGIQLRVFDARESAMSWLFGE